jgi:Ca-activated chloride channel family protein
MRFDATRWLFLLWVVPLAIAFAWWRLRAQKTDTARLASPELLGRLATHRRASRFMWRHVFFIVMILGAVLTLLRPQWGYHWEDVESRGVDIVVAVDLSDSMLAEDVSPNRLARAKRKISDLLGIIEGDRLGLVAFSGAAFLQSPLTQDRGAIEMFLDSLDTDLIPVKGTSLRGALDASLKAFEMAESSSRVLLLLTDGEELDEGSMQAAELAKQRGVRVYTIGIGTEKGAPIPNAAGGGFRKNPQGEIVFSKLNEEVLTRLAKATGGAFVRSVSDDADLVRIYRDEIRKDVDAGVRKQSRIKRFEERFQWPLALMVFAMIGEVLAGVWTRRTLKKVATTVLVVGGMWMSVPAPHAYAVPFLTDRYRGEQQYRKEKYPEAAQLWEGAAVAHPEDAEIKFNQGAAYYRAGDYAKAQEAWKSAIQSAPSISDPKRREKLKSESLYNLGNAAYRNGKLEDAVSAYRAAKEMDPEDREAAHNLELVLAEIKERKQKMQDQKNQSQQQKDQKKKEEQQQAGKSDKNEQKDDDQKKEDSKNQMQSQRDQKETEQKPQPQPSRKLSKEEAERLLESLNDEQKKAMERKMRRENPQQRPSENPYDW